MLTLNQIIKASESFATAHKQVNSFGSGLIQDFTTSGTTSYPAMWTDFEAGTITTHEYGTGVFVNTFRFYFLDRLLKGNGNLNEVLSDQQQVSLDFIAYTQSPSYFTQTDTIILVGDISLNLVQEKFHDDEVAGCYFDVQFKSSIEANTCQIPFGSPFPTPINNDTCMAHFADKEVPSGTKNGINTIFNLTSVPITNSEYVYVNGMLMSGSGVDYTLSGGTITFIIAPQSTDIIFVTYRF